MPVPIPGSKVGSDSLKVKFLMIFGRPKTGFFGRFPVTTTTPSIATLAKHFPSAKANALPDALQGQAAALAPRRNSGDASDGQRDAIALARLRATITMKPQF